MQHLEGETLADRLGRSNRPLPLPDALKIAIEIADALDKAHRAGITHRDVKPANIFLVRRGGASAPPEAKLLDFGLAKRAAPTVVGHGFSRAGTAEAVPYAAGITAQGTILGTFQYMAPEQVEGKEADARTTSSAGAWRRTPTNDGRAPPTSNTRSRGLRRISPTVNP